MVRSKTTRPQILVIMTAIFFVVLGTSVSFGASPGEGQLTVIEPDGKPGANCPLQHTSVKAEVSGFVAKVEVKQVFRNPGQEKIEAVYTFPLSANGAVDEMLMKIGDKVVSGEIKRREEAKRIYEAARDKGHLASLLDQERPNIFMQSVANIMPGQMVEIVIKYVEFLNYEKGFINFSFPMVVGPRFIPGSPNGKNGSGWAHDTAQVPDASRVTPPVAEEGKRAGHDIDLSVSIDAGMPIGKVESLLHEVDIERKTDSKLVVSLKNKKEIPNKDFALRLPVAADKVQSSVISHKDGDTGYVTVALVPSERVVPEQIAPRELFFIIDTSGSQSGKPLEKAKETAKYIIERMNVNDTFNVIDFNDTARTLFAYPKKKTDETQTKALQYIQSLKGSGGTRMIPAIWEALNTAPAENRLRIVIFMTDGLVGNDFEVISMVKKLRDKSRWFAFGTGNSVNRFLLDNIARAGGGEVDYVYLNSPGEEVAKKFYERIDAPVLTDISLSFEGISLEEVYPGTICDLWSHKPLVFKARYTTPGKGTVTIKGLQAGKPYTQTLDVTLPEKEQGNRSICSLWARAKVDDLMERDLMGIQRGNPDEKVKEEIIKVALAHKLMTQFTSFVAVEEAVVNVDGKPVRVTVPVELPEGVSREGVFGPSHANLKSRGAAPHSYRPPRGYSSPTASAGVGRPAQVRNVSPLVSQTVPHSNNRNKVASAAPRRVVAKASSNAKLSPELADLQAMKEKPFNYTKGEVTVKDGKVAVKVWLNRYDDKLMKLLEEKGVEISFKASTGKMIIGYILVEKLKDLSEIPEVRFIEPFSAKA